MDSKVAVYGFLLVLTVAVSLGIQYSYSLDDAVRELSLIEPQVKALEDGIAARKAQIEARTHAMALLSAADILNSEQDVVHKALTELQQKEIELGKQMVRAVKRVREQAAGQAIGDLVLPSGRTLKDSRIRSVDEEAMVVAYSEGITKIPVAELPQEMKDRFMFSIRVEKEPQVRAPVVIPPPNLASPTEKKPPAPKPRSDSTSSGNPRVEGNPALWKSVTRTSLGRVFVPGQGWLEVGPKGPIPNSGYGRDDNK